MTPLHITYQGSLYFTYKTFQMILCGDNYSVLFIILNATVINVKNFLFILYIWIYDRNLFHGVHRINSLQE